VQCLSHTLSPDPSTRERAEASLVEARQQPGFGVLLCNVLIDGAVAPELRQLAALVLKQYIKKHWVGEEQPETPASDKATIRERLPNGLRDASSRVRTAAGVAVAEIAQWDWPEAWPGLMEWMVRAIRERQDANLGECLGCHVAGWGARFNMYYCNLFHAWNHFWSCHSSQQLSLLLQMRLNLFHYRHSRASWMQLPIHAISRSPIFFGSAQLVVVNTLLACSSVEHPALQAVHCFLVRREPA